MISEGYEPLSNDVSEANKFIASVPTTNDHHLNIQENAKNIEIPIIDEILK